MAAQSTKTVYEFQSTLSVRRATHVRLDIVGVIRISIHALRKESDSLFSRSHRPSQSFQSTLSVRRATAEQLFEQEAAAYFNPRSP